MSTTEPPTPPTRHPLNEERPPLWPYVSLIFNIVLGCLLIFKLPNTDDPSFVTGELVARSLNTEDSEQHSDIIMAVIDHMTKNNEMIVAAVQIDPDLMLCPPTAPRSYFGQPSDYYGLPLAQDPPLLDDYYIRSPTTGLPEFSNYLLPEAFEVPAAETELPDINDSTYWSDYPSPGWRNDWIEDQALLLEEELFATPITRYTRYTRKPGPEQ